MNKFYRHTSPDMGLARAVAHRFAAALLMPSPFISDDAAAKYRLKRVCTAKEGLGPLT